MKKYLPLLFLLPLLAGLTADKGPFNEYYLPPVVFGVCAGDIDGDGDTDLVTAHIMRTHLQNPSMTLLENDGQGLFSISDTFPEVRGVDVTFFMEDMDHNGAPDLVIRRNDGTTSYVRIYYNDGQGSFLTFLEFDVGRYDTYRSKYVPGDLNGDGWPDVVIGSNDGSFWGLLYNDGTGKLLPPVYHSITGDPLYDPVCGDIDGDGKDDAVLHASWGQYKIMVFFGGTDSTYLVQGQADELRLGDLNNDGRNDIVALTEYMNIYQLALHEQEGDSFREHYIGVYEPSSHISSVIDMDGDGLQDIVLTSLYPQSGNSAGGIYILYNQGNFQFSEPQYLPIPSRGEERIYSSCADLDGNGTPDIATIRYKLLMTPGTPFLPYSLHLYFNRGDRTYGDEPLAVETPQPAASLFLQAYPNPFRTTLTFEFDLPAPAATAALRVYSLQGAFIRCFTLQNPKGGRYTIPWDGQACPPGIYLAALSVNGTVCQTLKIIKL